MGPQKRAIESAQLTRDELKLAKLGMYYTFASERVVVLPKTQLLKVDGAWIKMPPKQFELVTLVASEAGRIATYDFLGEELWEGYYTGNALHSLLNVHMRSIRIALGRDDLGRADGGAIETIRQVGYRAIA
jgi:DNA-binding response OmpR family regulator